MKGTGRLMEDFELSPKRRPNWAWLEVYLSPKDILMAKSFDVSS